MAIDNKIVQRIKKLLALADEASSHATPAEAASAAAKAQAMLFEHNLSMTDLGSARDDDATGYAPHGFVIEGSKNWQRAWQVTLANQLARVNFCRMIQWVHSGRVILIGREENVVVVQFLFDYLVKEIARLVKRDATIQCAGFREAERRAWMRSYCLGAVAMVARRLQDQQDRDMRATAASTALVRVTGAQLDTAVALYFPKLKVARGPKVSSNGGFDMGVEAGRHIPLNKGLGAGTSMGQLP